MVRERRIILILGLLVLLACLLEIVMTATSDNRNSSREKSALELCPDVYARDYCYRPAHMIITGCNPRVPTIDKGYCPKP